MRGTAHFWLPTALCVFVDYFGQKAVPTILPYHLGDNGHSPSDASYIISAQYYGLSFGSLFLGLLVDRVGARRLLILTMTGDVVFFLITGFLTEPIGLLIVRALAGFCAPGVPGFALLVQTCPKDMFAKCVVKMMTFNALGAMSGMTASSLLYDTIGWLGNNMVPACMSAATLVFLVQHFKSNPSTIHASRPPRVTGLVSKQTIWSKPYAAYLSCYLLAGWVTNITAVSITFVLKEQYNIPVQTTGMIIVCTSLLPTGEMLFISVIPRLLRRYPHARVRTTVSVLLVLNLAGQAIGTRSLPFFIVAHTLGLFLGWGFVATISARIQAICTQYAPKRAGFLTAIGRLFMNIGQASSVAVLLPIGARIGWWAPYAASSAILLCVGVVTVPVLNSALPGEKGTGSSGS